MINWKIFRRISVAVIFIIVQMFLVWRVEDFFPNSFERMRGILLTYLVMQNAIFAIPDLRSKFFRVKFFQMIPRTLLFFAIAVIIMSVSGGFLADVGFFGVLKVLGSVSIPIILVFGFYTSVIEEVVFRYWFNQRVLGGGWTGILFGSLIFGLFHFTLKGGSILAIIGISFIGVVLSFIRKKYSTRIRYNYVDPFSRQKKVRKMNIEDANIGFHWGYDVYLQGLLNIGNFVR